MQDRTTSAPPFFFTRAALSIFLHHLDPDGAAESLDGALGVAAIKQRRGQVRQQHRRCDRALEDVTLALRG